MEGIEPSGTVRVALYCRVSTEDQAERGTIKVQQDKLRSYAEILGVVVAGEYLDDGISGATPLGSRPEGKRLLDDAAKGQFSEVLVLRVDRLGRSLDELLAAQTSLKKLGVTIRSLTEPFDATEAIGKFLFQVTGSIAELERSTITERMVLGRDRAVRDGKWTNGPIPFGYDLDETGCLRPSERAVAGLGTTEAEAARSVFLRIANGSSTVKEAERFNALGVTTVRRYGGGTETTVGPIWTISRINQMIKNPVYTGTHVFKSRNGPIERSVPALVDQSTWDRAQAQLVQNRDLSTTGVSHRYLLRGLMHCGSCGGRYNGTPKRGRDGSWSHYYRCNSQLGAVVPDPAARCRGKMLPSGWLEDQVWRECRAFILDPGEAIHEAQRQLRERLTDLARLETERQGLEKLIAEKRAARQRTQELYVRGVATLIDVEGLLTGIGREEATLRASLEELDASKALAEAFEAHVVEATTLLKRLSERLHEIEQTNDWDTKRQIVEQLVCGVRVTTEGDGFNKRAVVEVDFAFGERRAGEITTGSCGCIPDRG